MYNNNYKISGIYDENGNSYCIAEGNYATVSRNCSYALKRDNIIFSKNNSTSCKNTNKSNDENKRSFLDKIRIFQILMDFKYMYFI